MLSFLLLSNPCFVKNMKYKISESLFWLLHRKIKDKEKIGGGSSFFTSCTRLFLNTWTLYGVCMESIIQVRHSSIGSWSDRKSILWLDDRFFKWMDAENCTIWGGAQSTQWVQIFSEWFALSHEIVFKVFFFFRAASKYETMLPDQLLLGSK